MSPVLTREFIREHLGKATPLSAPLKRALCGIFGVDGIRSGWKKRIVGMEATDEQVALIKTAGRLRKAGLVVRGFAKEMRDNPTPAEKAAWRVLRELKPKWHRQKVFRFPGKFYIADFWSALEGGTVLEIDGRHHEEPEQAAADAKRSRDMIETARVGGLVYQVPVVRVLRLKNEDVLADPEGAIVKAIGIQEKRPKRKRGKP